MKKIMIALGALLAASPVLAADGGWSDSQSAAIKAACYFFAVAIAAFGGTKAQSGAASVALEGIARNPSAADKIMTPMILGLALMESLVIFTLISIFLA
jgi:F-type H+-transporting ATPase subunit c